jgi:hypothetical protein
MVRTQIQLGADQHRELRRWAHRLGISLAEAVRRCVSAELERLDHAPTYEDRRRAALAACGTYRDPAGRGRVAKEHDRYLAEAFRE